MANQSDKALHQGWETIYNNPDHTQAAERMRVAGGWLYRDLVRLVGPSGSHKDGKDHVNVVFVPD